MSKLFVFLKKTLQNEQFIFAVFSGLQKGVEKTYQKVDVRPVMIKDDIRYQVTYYYDQKVTHENLMESDLLKLSVELMSTYFKQAVIYTSENDVQVLVNKKKEMTLLYRSPTRKKSELAHNRKKQYIIPEGEVCDFMVHLGIMDEHGRVISKKYDKFRQLNKYLEFVRDVLPLFKGQSKIRIIDFGCGKAYLTFALYYNLVKLEAMQVDIIGLDLKSDVIMFCNRTAEALGYHGLSFEKGDINTYSGNSEVDLVVSLHACNTATDASIFKAVSWKAKVIFAVPCCQHELFNQLSNPVMGPILDYGITRDKMTALVTDALRARALACVGYDVHVMEFVDMEHTPKNVLIRGIYTGKTNPDAQISYEAFRDAWGVKPTIDALVYSEQ